MDRKSSQPSNDGNGRRVSTSMEADPFGFSRRRRRIPASLEAFMKNQNDSPVSSENNNVQNPPRTAHMKTAPSRTSATFKDNAAFRTPQKTAEQRRTLDTVESSTPSLLTTPTSNRKSHLSPRFEESPAVSSWNVSSVSSRVTSPQETVSILSMGEADKTRDSTMASQTMHKQLLQLVGSLQHNLNEAQTARESQLEQINHLQITQQQLKDQVEELQHEKQVLQDQGQEHASNWEQHTEELTKQSHAKDAQLSDLQSKLRQSKNEKQQVQQALENLRLEHAAITQNFTDQGRVQLELHEARETLQRESLALQQERAELVGEQERWQHEHKELKEKVRQVAAWETSLQEEAELLHQERSQAKALQRQLLEMQSTQLDLEETQNEEDERLMNVANQLNTRVKALEEQEELLKAENQALEQKREEDHETLMHEKEELQQLQQNVMNQQSLLKDWDEKLQKHQTELDTKAEKVNLREREISLRVQELSQVEFKIRQRAEEIEQIAQSHEAKHVLTQHAIEDLNSRRVEEESRLETAMNNLEEIEQQQLHVKEDTKKLEEAYQVQLSRLTEELENAKKDIFEAKEELVSIQERCSAAVQQEEIRQFEVENQHELLVQNMELIQEEVENAESRKATLHLEILCLKSNLEKVQYVIEDERRAWNEEKLAAMELECRRLQEERQRAEQEIRQARETFEQELKAVSEQLDAKQDRVSAELMKQMDEIDRMQQNIAEATQSWTSKHAQLEQDRLECDVQQSRLDQLLSQLTHAQREQVARRQEIDCDRERLEKLVQTERQHHIDERRLLEQEADRYLQTLRQEHDDKLRSLKEALEAERASVEADLDATRHHLLEKERQHQTELSALAHEILDLESVSSRARIRADEYEIEVKQLRQQIATNTSIESDELEKTRLLMERIESSREDLEKKEKDVRKRECDLMDQKKQVEKQLEAINESSDEAKQRLDQLHDKEREIEIARSILQGQESLLQKKEAQITKKLRRTALQNLANKKWRDDQEVVSAAFSKWLRVTMIECTAVEAAAAENAQVEDLIREVTQRDELLRLKEEELGRNLAELESKTAELDATTETHAKTSKLLDELKGEMKRQQSALRETEEQLERERMHQMTERFKVQEELKAGREELTKEKRKLQSDRTALAQLDKFLQEKQKQLEDRDRRDQSAAEDSMAADRKLFDDAKTELLQKQKELKSQTENVRDMERSVTQRELEVATEASDYKRAEASVRRLAEQLQEREALVAERETRLSVSIQEFEEAQQRVRILAQKLQQKDEELESERRKFGVGSSRNL